MALAQFPLDVRVTVASPYPLRLSDYTDFDSRVFVEIVNNSQQIQNITLQGSLESIERGIRIETNPSNPPRNCIEILPGLTQLTGADLEDMFNPNHLRVTGTSINTIRGDEALPEGNYTLCLRAFDCVNPTRALSPIPQEFAGCISYDVAYVDPPVVILPECGEIISSEAPSIVFNWIFIPPAGGLSDVRFKIRIVEVDPPGRDPNDVMLSATAPYLFEEEDIFSNTFNLFPDADVLLEEGRSYAFQVIAYDPSEEVQFRNNGASVPCYFVYGGAGASGGFTYTPVYPKNGDFLPFNMIPYIVRFDPSSQAYRQFNSRFTLYENTGTGIARVDSHNRNLSWPRGPLAAQRSTAFPDISEYQSRHIAVYKLPSESPFELRRGIEYAWESDVDVRRSDNTTLNGSTSRVTFTYGMSPALLEFPPNNSTQPPGLIKFEWTSAKKPESLVPFYDIVQASRREGVSFFNGIVNERWIMEVSRQTSFDSIVYSHNGRITGQQLTFVADSASIISELYKSLETQTNFTDTGMYYWRLKWLSDPEDLNSKAYSISSVWNFRIGTASDRPGTTPTPTAERPGGCVSECLAAEITGTDPVAITVGQTLKMGKFDLKVTEISSSTSNTYKGKGEIQIPFLNNVRVKVAFEDVKANSAAQIFAGKAKAEDDEPFISTDSISTIINGIPMSVPDLTDAQSDAISAVFESGERLVSALGGLRPIGMPLGLDNEIDDHRFVIAITEMEFKPRRAAMTAVARVDIPDIGNKIPAFGARDVCITPSGLGDEYALYLARDHEISGDGDIKFAFNGAHSGDTTKASYISFDCRGFKCASIRGTVTFPNDKLIPENDDGSVDEDGKVKGTFAFKGCRGNNYMGEISFTAFQVKGMKGWGFKPISAYFDWSDQENPPGFALPSNYRDPDMRADGGSGAPDARLVNTWKGFFLKEVTLRAPPDFEHKVMGRAEFSLSNLIIDKTGLTASIEALNIIDYNDGDVKGWAFSLDTVSVSIVQNTNVEGRLSGKLGTPIFEEDEYLRYRSILSYSEQKLKYNFRVYVKDTLNVPMWHSKMYFNPNSEILFEYSSETNAETHLTALLHGGIKIEGDIQDAVSSIPALNMNGIRFEGLRLSTKDPKFGIQDLNFGHASPQKSVAGFPINIKDIGLNLNDITKPGIDFKVGLTLSDAGFSADLGFGIFAKLNLLDSRDRFGFDRLDLQSIKIEQTISGVSLKGELQFYRNDPTYGRGMKGMLDVTIPMDLTAKMTVQFGTIKNRPDARFNTADYYSYWYVDGLITLPTGIPIFSGFGVYGFGGGVYHHMRRGNEPPSSSNVLAADTLSRPSGVRYVPDFNTVLGLKVTAVIGTHTSAEAFNMDVTLEATFSSSHGLTMVSIRGDGYIMAKISERESAKVRANIAIEYHNDPEGGKRVSGRFDVYVKFGDYLKGAGENDLFVKASMHVDSEKWYFHMGTPTAPAGLQARVIGIRLDLMSYLMVGHGIPSTLPPLPPEITALIYGPGQRELDAGAVSAAQAEGREYAPSVSTKLEGGRGFAFGASVDFDTGKMRFAIFYAQLRLMLGFDINFSNDSSRVCEQTGLAPGINDWYAMGQVYAGLWGELGVGIDLWFIQADFPILQLSAAVMLRGGLPNPAWFEGRAGLQYSVFNGRINGYCNFKVEVGEKCTPVSNNPFGDIEFIADITPPDKERDISVFTYPAASFNLPVNQIIELPAGNDEEPDKVRVFRPFIHKFEIRKKRGGTLAGNKFELKEGNVIAVLLTDETLESFTEYEVTVEVRSYEFFPNGTSRLIMKNAREPWSEPKTITFVSGERPDEVVDENVRFTYPVKNQAYFLKGETSNNRGFIRYQGPPQNYLFVDEIEGKKYEYKARFIPVAGGDPIEQNIYPQQQRIEFDLPNLENSAYYGMQIIRKPVISRQDRIGQSLQISAQQVNPTIQNLLPINKVLQHAGTLQVELEGKKLPAEYAKSSEKILYRYYFRTSKFNRFNDKLASINFSVNYNAGFVLFENVRLAGRIEEPFDEVEINGFFREGVKVLEPMLQMWAPFTYNYHMQIARPMVYSLHDELNRMKNRRYTPLYGLSVPLNLPVSQLNRHRKGQPPIFTVELSSDTRVERMVQEWELRNAAGINPPPAGQPSAGSGGNTLTTPGLAGMMNNSYVSNAALGTNFNLSSNMASGSSSPSYVFSVIYNSSAFVKVDQINLSRNISRIMGNSHYNKALRKEYLEFHRRANQFLLFPLNFYNYRRGTYGFVMRYRYPERPILGNDGARTETFYLDL